MNYDLKNDDKDFLLHCVEVLNFRRSQYQLFLDIIENQGIHMVPKRNFLWQRLCYEDGFNIEKFDEEIAQIIKEVDSRGE